MVGVTYRVSAEEVEEATDNDETNNSFDGTAAVAVVEERADPPHRMKITRMRLPVRERST